MKEMCKNLKIVGENVYLRPITIEDTDFVLEWRNSKKVVDNFIYRKEITREEHIKWIENKVNKGLVHQFIVCELDSDTPVGVVYLQNFEEENRKAESGIFLGDIYGKGLGTQAYKLLTDYAFKNLGMHKVVAKVLAKNTASVRMNEKAGYKQEAYLKDELFLDGKYEDLILFGAINNDEKDK